MRISEAFEAFEIDELLSEDRSQKTLDSYRCTCRSFMLAVGSDVHINFIAYPHIIEWKKSMHDRGNSPAHMALQLRELRRVLTYLASHGYETLHPSEIKIPKFKYRQTEWLTIEEVGALLGVITSKRDKALFSCMFSSGARISELLSLDRDSIQNGQANIIGKGKVPGVLHFDDKALNALETYLSTRVDDEPALFISRRNRRICVQQCIVLIRGYAEKAGIKKRVTTHVLRHSFGTNLELNGLDIHGIANQMRHKKLETTKIYLHASELRKTADYEKYHSKTPI